MKTIWTLDLDDLSRADTARVRWLRSTLAAIETITHVKNVDAQVPALLNELGCTLTEIVGVGVVTAMTLLTEIVTPNGSIPKRSSLAGAARHPSPSPPGKVTVSPADLAWTWPAIDRSTASCTSSMSPKPGCTSQPKPS